MNIAEHFDYQAQSFEDLVFDWENNLEVSVSGNLEIEVTDYYTPYNGNSLSSNFTQGEITGITLTIDYIELYNHDTEEIVNDPVLLDKIVKSLISDAQCGF